MKSQKFLLVLCLATILAVSMYGKSSAEELIIPPEAHQKAIQALEALGPERESRKASQRIKSYFCDGVHS